MGSATPLECWNTGLILSPAQWVKDPAWPQLQHRSQFQLGSDPWPRNSVCHGVAKKKKRKEKKCLRKTGVIMDGFMEEVKAELSWKTEV